VTKAVWKRINDSITAAVDSLMLSDLIEDSERCRDRLKSSGPKEEQVNCSDRYIIE
jgi:DNA-binding IscR family transcriptional regulator